MPRDVTEVEVHLARCPHCSQMYQELLSIRQMLSLRIKFPEPSSIRCLKYVRRKRILSQPIPALRQLARDCRSFVRDLNPLSLISRVAALPLTLAFFAVLITQFPVLRFDRVKFPAISMQGWTEAADLQPVATRKFATRQGQTRFRELMDIAWRLPYEDSLSLVAEITPEGNARIGGVLEYPKSNELLNAADLALRTSQFVASDANTRFIFSFQKIDVWEDGSYPHLIRTIH